MNHEIQSQLANLRQTRAALDEIRQTLDSLLDQFQLWIASPDSPPTPDELQQQRDELVMAYARYRILQDQYATLLRLNARLLKQQESAKDTFLSGWDARLPDIISRLTEPEYAQLREALARIDGDDNALPY
jgi:hypothetical protein